MVGRAPTPMILIALRVLRAGLLLGIPVAAILLLRTAPQSVTPVEGAAAAHGEAARAEARRPLDWYAPLWERDLRQPPIPPAPVEVRPARQSREALPRLVTTFVESEQRYAHFLDAQGKLRFCGLDEQIGAFRIAAIEPGRARLTDGDFAVWIEMPKPELLKPETP